jgi:hypothetical protein
MGSDQGFLHHLGLYQAILHCLTVKLPSMQAVVYPTSVSTSLHTTHLVAATA